MNNFIRLTGDTTFLVPMEYNDVTHGSYYIMDLGDRWEKNPVKVYEGCAAVTRYLREQKPGMMLRLWVGYSIRERKDPKEDKYIEYLRGISAWGWICDIRYSPRFWGNFDNQPQTLEEAKKCWLTEARWFRNKYRDSAYIPIRLDGE